MRHLHHLVGDPPASPFIHSNGGDATLSWNVYDNATNRSATVLYKQHSVFGDYYIHPEAVHLCPPADAFIAAQMEYQYQQVNKVDIFPIVWHAFNPVADDRPHQAREGQIRWDPNIKLPIVKFTLGKWMHVQNPNGEFIGNRYSLQQTEEAHGDYYVYGLPVLGNLHDFLPDSQVPVEDTFVSISDEAIDDGGHHVTCGGQIWLVGDKKICRTCTNVTRYHGPELHEEVNEDGSAAGK